MFMITNKFYNLKFINKSQVYSKILDQIFIYSKEKNLKDDKIDLIYSHLQFAMFKCAIIKFVLNSDNSND